MRITTELQKPAETLKLAKRLLWFVGIYFVSVIAFTFVSSMLSLLVPH